MQTINATVNSQSERRMPYLQVMFEVAQRISSSLSMNEVLNAIVESTAHAVDAKGCSLLLLSPDKQQLLHSATYGLSDWYVKKGSLLADRSLSQVLEGKPVQILNAAEDENVQYRWQKKKEGIASILAVPVILDNDVIGMMRVYTSEPRQFSKAEIGFVESVASLGALALQKAWLHEAISKSLQQCTIDLSKLENEKGNLFHFLSMTAHDLKAPLSSVQTYFGVMLGGFVGEMDEKQRNILERCSTRITELLQLINDLLEISKVEAGQVITEMHEVSTKAIVDGSVETGRILAERKGINLEVDTPKRLPRLYAAGSRLQHLLTHLMSNAITYTDPGGSVKLKIVNSQCAIQFEISDTGIGIPQEELSQVFHEFFRASNNVKAKGTGLGVSIAKRVIEAHGGQIWVESPCPETGKGCKFSFTIPKTKNGSHLEVIATP
ncbi:MAG: GAF domain-containing sensor histidine kinase [Dehalococcoidia bacterium]